MIPIEVGSIVKCAECDQSSEIEFIGDYEGVSGYYLSCQHRNAFCKKCNQMARDVSDTHKKLYVMCNNCDDYFDYYEPDFEPPVKKKNGIVEKAKEKYARAYDTWTTDERICLTYHLNCNPLPKLVEIFERQPQVLTNERNTSKNDQLENNSAARWLGQELECKSCHLTKKFIYKHLESIKPRVKKNIKDITQDDFIKIIKFFSCPNCGCREVIFK